MALKPMYLLLAGGGGIFIWSGIKGKSVTGVARQLIGGQSPNSAPNALQLTAFTTPDTSSAGGSDPGNVNSGSGNANELTVAKYLMANGYSRAAAAGIASCIAGESGGDPEARQQGGGGGEGLIQWTPGSTAKPIQPIITGNATNDLKNQMQDIIGYNDAQGSALISMLNQISDPVAAADFYSQHFERPAVTNSDVRASVAQSIYNQL